MGNRDGERMPSGERSGVLGGVLGKAARRIITATEGARDVEAGAAQGL